MRILEYHDNRLNWFSRLQLVVIIHSFDRLWERAKRKIDKQWDDFGESRDIDLFGLGTRVQINLIESHPVTLTWELNLFWEREDYDYEGMYISVHFFLGFPYSVHFVF